MQIISLSKIFQGYKNVTEKKCDTIYIKKCFISFAVHVVITVIKLEMKIDECHKIRRIKIFFNAAENAEK